MLQRAGTNKLQDPYGASTWKSAQARLKAMRTDCVKMNDRGWHWSVSAAIGHMGPIVGHIGPINYSPLLAILPSDLTPVAMVAYSAQGDGSTSFCTSYRPRR